MGIHTSIYREKYVGRDDLRKRYKIKLLCGEKEVKLINPVAIREEFYFGKGVSQISNWFYKRLVKRYGKKECRDLFPDEMFNQFVWVDDFEELLKDINKVLARPELARKVLPYPRGFALMTMEGNKWRRLTTEELYGEGYFDDLRRAKVLLEQLVAEQDEEVNFDYTLDVG